MDAALLGPICAFMASVTWAIGSSNYSRMSRTQSAFQVNLSRALFALPLFFIATFVTSGGLVEGAEAYRQLRLEHFGWFTASMICSYALADVLFFWSTVSLGVPGALAIASSYPIMTALFSFLVLGNPMSGSQWLGLFVAFGGVVTVILTDPKQVIAKAGETMESPAASKILDEKAEVTRMGNTPVDRQAWKSRKAFGVMLATATAVCWAMNTYFVGRGGADLNATVTSTVRMGLAILLSALFSVIIGRARPQLVSPAYWRKYWWVFLVEAFAGSYFFAYGLAHSSLVLGAILTSLAPVLAVPVAVALRLERFSWIRTGAVAAVVAGLSLL